MENTTQKLWVLRGAPGSGKSTKAKEILKDISDGAHFEADMFFERTGTYVFEAEKIGHAHSWCMQSTKAALQQGKTVVVSNTFTKHREFRFYIELAEKMGIPYEIIHMTGQFKNVHNVPDEVVNRMLANFQPYEQNSQEVVY
jgi:predicted kinase